MKKLSPKPPVRFRVIVEETRDPSMSGIPVEEHLHLL